jgi:hypothetical protein
MRTTVELSATHRARLLRLAAERGEKGFSRLIAEALDGYLENQGAGDDRESARRLRGVLGEADARELEQRVRIIREDWR